MSVLITTILMMCEGCGSHPPKRKLPSALLRTLRTTLAFSSKQRFHGYTVDGHVLHSSQLQTVQTLLLRKFNSRIKVLRSLRAVMNENFIIAPSPRYQKSTGFRPT